MTCEHEWKGHAEAGELTYCTTMGAVTWTGTAYLVCAICGAKAEAALLSYDAVPKEVSA